MMHKLLVLKTPAAIFLLCCLVWIHADAQRPVPLSQYHLGMRFYFPADSVKQADATVMPGYSDERYAAIIHNPYSYETYDELATKVFRLDSIQTPKTYDVSGDVESILLYVLVDVHGSGKPEDTLHFVFQVNNPLAISRRESRNKQSLVLPGAVLADDVDSATIAYAGKHFYSKFPVSIGKKKLKYQEVVITDVTAGTVYGPVRLVYKAPGADSIASIDVVTSGTNVLPVFWKGHLFADSFQAGNPRDSVEKIGDAGWDSICQGLVGKGMTSKQVAAALGMPDKDKVHRTIAAAGESIEWDYDQVQVTFEGDKVAKLVFGAPAAKK
jgi:hypothetical protein